MLKLDSDLDSDIKIIQGLSAKITNTDLDVSFFVYGESKAQPTENGKSSIGRGGLGGSRGGYSRGGNTNNRSNRRTSDRLINDYVDNQQKRDTQEKNDVNNEGHYMNYIFNDSTSKYVKDDDEIGYNDDPISTLQQAEENTPGIGTMAYRSFVYDKSEQTLGGADLYVTGISDYYTGLFFRFYV